MRYQAALRPDVAKPLQNGAFDGKGQNGQKRTEGEKRHIDAWNATKVTTGFPRVFTRCSKEIEMEWNDDMDAAPKGGSPIQARIPGHGQDNVIAWLQGFQNEAGEDCGTWVFVEDQEPPACWTDGVCWISNEDGKPSVQPTHWKHLPPTNPGDSQ